ncbi:peptidylprolyl isomerase [Chelativorans intermedius]|uniref:Parvulin-like PPIase n=1 Tax=Chelativorans intermedius TaxID=515947 RepID=A0ABV6DBP7_9HYPH|nr:peptidylprolyl isomerase [Chelativorans intermedius]MCT8998046.1 peptidylprolyl isomerase [Chelativorans intermedius]
MPHTFRRFLAARAGAAALLAAISFAPALAQEGAVVATINGEPITEADLALAEQELSEQFARLPQAERRAAALSAVIDVRLLAAQAEAEGLDQSEDFQQRMAFLRERALHSAFVDRNVVAPITEEEMRARYDAEVAKITPEEEVRARHILVESEEEARQIIEALDAGGDFAALAEEKSKDGSSSNGGDLGYFTRGRMVPAFEEAAFALEPGSYSSEPVETQFGWHVIKVEDKRRQSPPAFEQVQNQIRSLLIRERYVAALSSLRNAAEVDIPDEALKTSVDELFRQQTGQADTDGTAQ